MAWSDVRFGKHRLLSSFSSDRGRTWSEEKAISPEAAAGSSQYQQMIAVNKDGTVGVLWFDNRIARDRYDAYFTASVDGGETFLPAARVTSESSDPRGLGNLQPAVWHTQPQGDALRSTISSAYSFRPAGGDYIGLDADPNGTFHAFWPDARSGTFQVYTARIDVRPNAKAPEQTIDLKAADVTKQLTLVFDPGRFDPGTRELHLPVRLKNVSQERVLGPLVATLTKAEDRRTRRPGPCQAPYVVVSYIVVLSMSTKAT